MLNFQNWLHSLNTSQFNLQTKMQECDENSILLFNRPRSNKDKIYQLLSETKYAFLVTNDDELEQIQKKIYIEEKLFQAARASLINKFYSVNKKITYIGITGTNGKTSTTHFLREILYQLGLKVGSAGTLGYYIGNHLIEENKQTTPDLYDLRKFIYNNQSMLDCFIMEVSSHALDQERLYGVELDCALWTNFTQDHLDYHKTMKDYFNAKAKIVNILNPNGKLLVLNQHKNIWEHLKSSKVKIIPQTKLNLPQCFNTNFNQENILLAIEAAKFLQQEVSVIDFNKIPPVPGRFNLEMLGNKRVIIDFAHTPDAIENVLKQIRQDFLNAKVVTVFGCGGDRDRSKRPQMGQIVSTYSDVIIVTSDNPRSESPQAIIDDVMAGVDKNKPSHCIENRVEAIKKALSDEINAEIILIAGKGHETSMDYNGKMIEHNDHDVVRKIREKLL